MDLVFNAIADIGNRTIKELENRYLHYKASSGFSGSKNFINKLGQANRTGLVTKNGSIYTLSIKAPVEWKFINYGINGLVTKHGSKFNFKNKGINADGLKRIRMWMRQNAIIPDARTPYLLKLYKKDREKALTRLANYVLVPSIKKKGIKPKPFATDVLNPQYLKKIRQELVRNHGAQVMANFRK